MNKAEIEKIIREHIEKTVHLSLATVKGDAPWVCELHFAFDDDLNLYWRSLSSRRHSQEIAANPKVAGNIVKQHAIDEAVVGVYFEGVAEMLEAGDDQNKAAECVRKRLNIEEDIIGEAADPEGHQFYKATITNWYAFGRFGADSGQKLTLPWNGKAK